jgi:hypothetical protein
MVIALQSWSFHLTEESGDVSSATSDLGGNFSLVLVELLKEGRVSGRDVFAILIIHSIAVDVVPVFHLHFNLVARLAYSDHSSIVHSSSDQESPSSLA